MSQGKGRLAPVCSLPVADSENRKDRGLKKTPVVFSGPKSSRNTWLRRPGKPPGVFSLLTQGHETLKLEGAQEVIFFQPSRFTDGTTEGQRWGPTSPLVMAESGLER